MKKNKQEAFTIVETLITLLAITLMIAGPLAFMYRSYNYSQFIKAKIIASGFSQEGLELATSLRNKDLAEFKTVATSCVTGCMVDWNGVSNTPTFTPCSDESCRLFKSSTDQNVQYGVNGDLPTDFYRYVKFTQNGVQSYTAESISWTTINSIKVEVNLKKIIFNIVTK